jgi:aldehyde:ferredoxin oxidoreductase
MQISGNEMPGYPTGYSSLAGIAVAARQSHLCNGGYSIDQAMAVGGGEVNTDAIADALLKEEVERCMLNSLVICLFARKVYDRETILKAFAAINRDMTDEELTAAAKRIYATKLRIKKRLGRDLRDVKLPKRFFQTPTMHGVLDEATAYEIIEKYRELTIKLTEELEELEETGELT